MASHGSSRHVKRLNAPNAAGIARKSSKWFRKPDAGAHNARESLSLGTLLVERLRVCENQREAKKLCGAGLVRVDGRPVKKPSFSVGLMDIISIPKLSLNVVLVFKHDVLQPLPLDSKHAATKLCRVVGKTKVLGGQVQLGLHDGRTLLVPPTDASISPGDTLQVSVPNQKIQGVLKLVKGATALVVRGRHAGQVASVEELMPQMGKKKPEAKLTANGESLITLKDYVFVVQPGFSVT
ncbi:hypothetical protein HY572_02625 [Candidatus Micrarchaeota archaeon]|nr:hypothetical protein [Candidatus Micrarchaeota archaeon]